MYDLTFVQISFMFKQNALFIFKLYLVCIIIFLTPICYLVTREVVKLLADNSLFQSLIPVNRNQKLTKEQILSLAKIYIQKKQWLSCILMLELYIKVDHVNLGAYYNSIGFCYQLISLNHLAKYYYTQATEVSPLNILFLKNLANIYSVCNDLQASLSMYKKILELDPRNQIVIDQINKLMRQFK